MVFHQSKTKQSTEYPQLSLLYLKFLKFCFKHIWPPTWLRHTRPPPAAPPWPPRPTAAGTQSTTERQVEKAQDSHRMC